MLSVFETGEASFRLSDRHDEDVGWIRGGTLGFDGFDTEADAVAAALAGSEALRGHLERVTGAAPPVIPPNARARVVHDGAYEWVSLGSLPLARLFRPGREGTSPRRRGHAVEFVLPSYAKSGLAITAAQIVHHAISTRAAARGTAARGVAAPATVAPVADSSATGAGAR